jgi:TRAP-type C4-dicarboxylate transport system permease small subunit
VTDNDRRSGDADAPKRDIDVPPTRKHEVPAEDPPARESRVSLEKVHVAFPDDGPTSRLVRTIDRIVGQIEQGVLFALLAAVVLVAASSALSEKLFDHQLGDWWHFVVRKGVFVIALLSGAFATQHQRHLAMDLVSRKLPPRGRIILAIVLELFTIAIAGVLYYAGSHLYDNELSIAEMSGHAEHIDVGPVSITLADVVGMMRVAGVLIALHAALHATIAIDYLARGKLLPEKARSH